MGRAATQRGRERAAALVLAAVLGALATVLALALPATHPGYPTLAPWTFAALFAAAQVSVVHVQVRRQSASVGLGSVAGVIGLAFCPPHQFVAATALGSFAVLLVQRKQSWPKLLFNLGLFGITWSATRGVYELLAPGGRVSDEHFAAAALVAVLSGIVVSGAGLAAVLLASTGHLDLRALGRTCATALLLDGAAGILGVLAVLLTLHSPVGLPMLAAVVVLLVAGARAYSLLDWRHRRMASLYAFTNRVNEVDDLRDLALRICAEAREVLHCDIAELAVRTSPGVLSATVGPDGPGSVTRRHGSLPPAPPEEHDEVLLGRALRVPLLAGGTSLGFLVVRGRWPYLGAFRSEDRRLCSSLADHAAVALQGALLLQQVRTDAEERRRQALHDPVTGLWNRRGLVEAAEQRNAPASLMVLDLQGFSDINDTLGQRVGDQLLRHIGHALTVSAGSAHVARFGNDEFGVLLDGAADRAQALRRAQEVLADLERPFALHGLTLQVQTQAGLAVAETPDVPVQQADVLVQQAEAALAAAKRSGMALHVHDRTDDEHNARRVRLVSDLRRAVAADALDVFYQPKLDPRTGSVVGVEALARWVHPDEGFVPPDVFIPLAEQAGLIPALTASVLRSALTALQRWRGWGYPLTMAVNVSPRLLREPTLVDEISAALERTGVPAEALVVEITESAVMDDVSTARAMLSELRRRGVSLSLDDFGTGHSSLAYLATLPVDELKLDKSFVLGLPADQTALAIVRAAIDLAHQLGLTVVAEGVETLEAQELLVRRECDVVQGYLHSRPLPLPEFEDWLRARHTAALSPA